MATNSMAVSPGVEVRSVPKEAVVLAGRFFFALIFLLSAAGHFSQQEIGYAASQGVPIAWLLVPASGVLALIGGLSRTSSA